LNACAGVFFLIAGGVHTQWTMFHRHPPLRFATDRSYEIKSDQPPATLELLRNDPAIEAATISGHSLRFPYLRWLDSRESVSTNDVDPSYFAFMGSKLLRGRIFNADEPYSMVVGQSAARKLWPTEDPIGKTLRMHWYDRSSAEYTIVGMVEDTGEAAISPGPRLLEVFVPLEQSKIKLAVVLARTRPGAAISWSWPATQLDQMFIAANAYATMFAALLDFMAISITLVSTLGLGGILWCAVVQRAKSLAIRVALGARRRDIIRVLTAEFVTPLSIGIGIGVLIGSEFWLYSGIYLRGVSRFDPPTYLGAITLFAGIGLTAAGIAGAQAWKVAPAAMLKGNN